MDNNNLKDSVFYFASACSKYALGDYDGSIDDFTTVISLNPDSNDAYHHRGECKVGLKDFSGAIDDFSKAIKIDPDDPLKLIPRPAIGEEISVAIWYHWSCA